MQEKSYTDDEDLAVKRNVPPNNLVNDYAGPFCSLVFAETMSQKIISRALDRIYSQQIERKIKQYSTLTCDSLLQEMVNLQLTNCDPGERFPGKSPPAGNEWAPEAEVV